MSVALAGIEPRGRWIRLMLVAGLHAVALALLLREPLRAKQLSRPPDLRLYLVTPPVPPVREARKRRPSPLRRAVREGGGALRRSTPRVIKVVPIDPLLPAATLAPLAPLDIAGVLGAGNGDGDGRGSGVGPGAGAAMPSVPQVIAPRWVWKPSEAQLAPYVPRAAWTLHTSGKVVLVCQVSLKQRARHCRIADERPRNLGFGDAALDASHMFRIYPIEVGGTAVDGGLVAIPVEFSFR